MAMAMMLFEQLPENGCNLFIKQQKEKRKQDPKQKEEKAETRVWAEKHMCTPETGGEGQGPQRKEEEKQLQSNVQGEM